MPDDTSIKGFSQQQTIDAEAKANLDAAKATDAHTQAMQRQTRAMRDNTQAWGRLRAEQETFLGRFKEIMSNVRQTSNDFMGAGRAMGGFFDSLKQGTTITAMYNRKLDAMRKGQTAFSGTMVATTNNISQAMDQSQKYVNAVHDSYRSAHKVAGEWRVETKALQQAVDDLNSRFATQIAVSGDMKGAIEGMRKEALIMSKYLGTSMQDVMDSWNERLQQTTLTLDESRQEMIRTTYQADQYAQDIQKLGDRFLKTGNIGKKEFTQMVRDMAKQFRTGTVQIDGYSRALRGLLVETKKMGLSTDEQRVAQEGFSKTIKAMFTMDSELSVFGMKAAQQVRDMWDDPKWLAQQDKQVQARLKMVRKEFTDAEPNQQMRAIMEVMKGSSAGSAMGMRLMANMTNLAINRELIASQTGGSLLTANAIAKQIQSGEAAKMLDQKANDEASKQREEQTEVWKKDIESLVKATHTPKDLEYKLVAEVERIRKLIEFYAKGSIAGSLLTQGAFMGVGIAKNLLAGGGVLGGGGFLGLGGGAGGAAGAAGAGGAGAAGAGGAAGAAGVGVGTALAGTAAAGAAGVAVGVGLDYGVGYALKKLSSEREQKIMELSGETPTLSGKLADKATEVIAKLTGDTEALDMMTRERVTMEGAEYESRRKMLDAINKEIASMKKREKNLTLVEQERLKAIKKQKAQIEKSIGKRIKQEKQEAGEHGVKKTLQERKRITDLLKQVEGGSATDIARSLVGATYTDKPGLTTFKAVADLENVGKNLMITYASLSKEQKKKIEEAGGIKEVAKQAQLEAARERLARETTTMKEETRIKNLPIEEIKQLYETKYGTDLFSGIDAMSAMAVQSERRTAAAQKFAFELVGEQADTVSNVETNAKGEIKFTMPGPPVTVKLRGLDTAVGVQTQKKQSKG